MPIPIRRLVEERGAPCTIHRDVVIRDALATMIEHDYSQLPVVDDREQLVGLFSEQALVRGDFHVGRAVNILKLTVGDCVTRPATLTPDADLSDALTLLRVNFAVIIVESERPVGILTTHDITYFLNDLYEDMMLVEQIELPIRGILDETFSTEKDREDALLAAFGNGRRDRSRPARRWERLTLCDYRQIVTAVENWPRFEAILGPKNLFAEEIGQVVEIRNQLMHFRGRPNAVQHDLLRQAYTRITNRLSHTGERGAIR